MRRVLAFLLVLFLSLPVVVSCARQNEFWAGEPLTAEDIERMQQELNRGEDEGEGGGDNPVFDGTVYWLDGGKVYHMDPMCYHVRDKENVQSGSEQDALNAGKTKRCSHCNID